MDENMQLITVFVTGLFSLLGVYVGAKLTRRNEFKKWQRNNRSDVYANFFNLIINARKNASDAMFDTTLETLSKDIKVTEAYYQVSEYVRIVCLYLPKKFRLEFRRLVEDFISHHTDRSIGDSRLKRMDEKLDAIQEIFEENL
jgi:hypothetical protein